MARIDAAADPEMPSVALPNDVVEHHLQRRLPSGTTDEVHPSLGYSPLDLALHSNLVGPSRQIWPAKLIEAGLKVRRDLVKTLQPCVA